MNEKHTVSIGNYLATRFEQLGITHYFTVAGNYNLALLNELLKNKNLTMINCCNELNAGYAADGYARAKGVGILIVTYSVGGLCSINAVAGSFADDLPVIVISGAPKVDGEIKNRRLHHTLDIVNYRYMRNIYAEVVPHAITIKNIDEVPYLLDEAFKQALTLKKPVYVEIPAELSAFEIPAPTLQKFELIAPGSPQVLATAVDHAASLLNAARKPVLIAGAKLRSWNAIKAFQELIDSSHYGFAIQAFAKGFLSEQQPQYLGVYWGEFHPSCTAVIESSDMCLAAGNLFTDFTTNGFSTQVDVSKLINVAPDHVRIVGQTYSNVNMAEFLTALAKKIKPNDNSLQEYKNIKKPVKAEIKKAPMLTVNILYAHLQKMLDKNTTIIAEVGDTWFNSVGLILPEGCEFEIQLYSTTGWSVGAALGYAAAKKSRRVLCLVGDGSFQMSAQEVSTMIRFQYNPIIVVINNSGFLTEGLIQKGPYITVQNWKYSELVEVFNGENGNGWGSRVTTEEELVGALEKARNHTGLVLIEAVTAADDFNIKTLEFIQKVAAFDKIPPCG